MFTSWEETPRYPKSCSFRSRPSRLPDVAFRCLARIFLNSLDTVATVIGYHIWTSIVCSPLRGWHAENGRRSFRLTHGFNWKVKHHCRMNRGSLFPYVNAPSNNIDLLLYKRANNNCSRLQTQRCVAAHVPPSSWWARRKQGQCSPRWRARCLAARCGPLGQLWSG